MKLKYEDDKIAIIEHNGEDRKVDMQIFSILEESLSFVLDEVLGNNEKKLDFEDVLLKYKTQ